MKFLHHRLEQDEEVEVYPAEVSGVQHILEIISLDSSNGFDATPERLEQLSRDFQNGDATLEVSQTYASDDLVVLVYVERQDGEVHGLPTQDWSLRVTQVFRRNESGAWDLVHRHADPLTRPISLERLSALARGD
jgi:hypothetical protein